MTDAQEAHESWVRSSSAWIEAIEKGERNRVYLLDAPMLKREGSVEGHRVLDVECGEGRFCRMLSDRGAVTIGLDPTPPLLAQARKLHPDGTYVEGKAEALPFGDGEFDLAVSYLTLIDIADFRAAIFEMARVLRRDGRLIVANLQSFATTRPFAWYRNERGEKLHVAVEEYFTERATRAEWGGISILYWHRTLEAYMAAFLEAGFVLRAFEEPRPTLEAVNLYPELKDEHLVPLFYVMEWERS
ncbi:class I SAM-dependent methyltransferase [soil metagenome]